MAGTLFVGYCTVFVLAQLGLELLARRARAASEAFEPTASPEPVTLVKPIHGIDAFSEACLRSWLTQAYAGAVQVVFSLQDPAAPARGLLDRLAKEPGLRPFEVIANPIEPGFHGKTSNLLHGVRAARHGILVLSDADIEAPSGTLGRLVGRLQAGYDLVGCLVVHDRPEGFWARVYATVWNAACNSLGGTSMWLGIQPLLPGGTVAIRAGALRELGGVEAFGRFVIDDYALSRLALARGKRGGLGPTVRSPVGPMDLGRWVEKIGRGSAGWRELPAFPFNLLLFPLVFAYLWAVPAFAWAGRWDMVALGLCLVVARSCLLGFLARDSEGRWRPLWEHVVFETACQVAAVRALLSTGFRWDGVEYRRGGDRAIERVR